MKGEIYMATCKNCGAQLPEDDSVRFCANCGAPLEADAVPPTAGEVPPSPTPGNGQMPPPPAGSPQQNPYGAYPPPTPPMYQQPPQSNPDDKGGCLWGGLCFLFPIVGLILYLVWRKERRATARSCGIGALVGVIVQFVFGILMSIVQVVLLDQLYLTMML